VVTITGGWPERSLDVPHPATDTRITAQVVAVRGKFTLWRRLNV
jgi:hypothetical protein